MLEDCGAPMNGSSAEDDHDHLIEFTSVCSLGKLWFATDNKNLMLPSASSFQGFGV